MFVLYKTVERPDGLFETLMHGSYVNRTDAEQAGDTLRLLYPWIKAVRIEIAESAEAAAVPLLRKKMAGSIQPESERQRKSS